MRFGWDARKASNRLMQAAIFMAVALVAAFSYVYFYEPFSPFGNSLLINGLTITAALSSATCATMIWAIYEKTDEPRRVWGYFAFGLWLWLMGEVTWGYFNLTLPDGEVPVGVPDTFWVIAYYFLAQALLSQYRILVRPTRGELAKRITNSALFFGASFALIFSVLKPFSASSSVVDLLVNAFYPAGDLTLALAAIWLTSHFQGGALGRPWIGLLVFAFSDLMYAWLQLSGTYAWSLEHGTLVSGMSDTVYFSAYLILSIGSFSQWLFLKYGLHSPSKAR